jgi:hypothetical protein
LRISAEHTVMGITLAQPVSALVRPLSTGSSGK